MTTTKLTHASSSPASLSAITAREVNRFRFFDSKKVGAGCWYVLHLLAATGEIAALNGVIRQFLVGFTCVKCRKHIRSYISDHPVPEDPILAFNWTVDFHNQVNARLYEEQGVQKILLSAEGAKGLHRELTVGAVEDEARFESEPDSGCPGCGNESGGEKYTDLKEGFEQHKYV